MHPRLSVSRNSLSLSASLPGCVSLHIHLPISLLPVSLPYPSYSPTPLSHSAPLFLLLFASVSLLISVSQSFYYSVCLFFLFSLSLCLCVSLFVSLCLRVPVSVCLCPLCLFLFLSLSSPSLEASGLVAGNRWLSGLARGTCHHRLLLQWQLFSHHLGSANCPATNRSLSSLCSGAWPSLAGLPQVTLGEKASLRNSHSRGQRPGLKERAGGGGKPCTQ